MNDVTKLLLGIIATALLTVILGLLLFLTWGVWRGGP
jgi:hypothetical protein